MDITDNYFIVLW